LIQAGINLIENTVEIGTSFLLVIPLDGRYTVNQQAADKLGFGHGAFSLI
jgi:hypothetical protein